MKKLLLVALLLTVCRVGWAANTKTTVSQVTTDVSLTTDVDYTISSATPFISGVVDIQNTDYAVLILSAVKPSVAISQWLGHVKINGAQAVNGQNCQVKIYNQGCIILPYGDGTKPLTVYAGQNFSGESCNDFGLEDTGGFMNTLTEEKLNNRIRSFKLKRGYMVTFSLRTGGYGYSRCFIAADQDLEVASLPDIMDQKISSYRVFKWYDTGKRGVAARDGNAAECSALNVTSTYGWGVGSDMGPDIESVPHHIHEGWPSPSELGKATWSPHMKTNNEPRNPKDENPCELKDILNNWEQLMRTGLRLCSPSSWDGSDYWNAEGFLKEFFDSIDARGWRCDIIDLHCYWPEANFGNIKNYADKFGRPVWVSEWVWGASWGTNTGSKGAFNDGVTEAQNAEAVKRICQTMNNMNYVERYFYWDDERDPSKVYKNDVLTPTGTAYAAIDGGVAYNGSKNYIPSIPTMKAPTDLRVDLRVKTGKIVLTWKEYNGELNQSITVERRNGSSGSWQNIGSVAPKDDTFNYTYEDNEGSEASQYRIHVVGFKGENLYSDVETPGHLVYLYNIGARQWLTSGNSWGTRASLTSHGGHDVFVQKVAEGKYTIETQIYNNSDKHFMRKDGSTAYVDQAISDDWMLTPVDGTVNGGTAYLLKVGGNLSWDGGKTTTTSFTNGTDENSQWLLQTVDDRMDMLATATSENPIDATFLLPGADFHKYDLRNNAWLGGPVLGGSYDGNIGNQCAEKYDCTFDVYQTISGAPAGNYQLKVQGFYRNGVSATSGNDQNALLYANSHTQPLVSILKDAGKWNDTTPNSMADAAQFFLQGYYENELSFTLTEGEELQIGIKKSVETDRDWAIFDNFRLIYLGNDDVAKTTTKTAAGHCWSTFYSGVANYQLPEGATAYTATVSDGALHLHKLGSVIPKECAVIIVNDNAGQLTMEKTNETVDTPSDNALQGADTETRTSSYTGTVYVMGASTEAGADFGFHHYTGYELPAGKAFLVLNGQQSRPLTICFDDEVTAVDGIRQPTTGKVYNLQGLHVTSPRKGVYLKNGNKVVVK